EAEQLPVVADARDSVLAGPVCPRARLVVREVPPGVAVEAVVLAHRSPLTVAQIRAELAPRNPFTLGLSKPALLGGLGRDAHRYRFFCRNRSAKKPQIGGR